MFELPFQVDAPLPTGALTLVFSILFGALLWAYDRNIMKVGDVLGWFFERKFGATSPAQGRMAGRILLLAMTIIFGAMAAFGFIVGLGIIENGSP